MLRKLIYPDYYTSARQQFLQSQDPKAMFEIHMGHCVDILMQAIQCSGNLNLITMHWVREESIPFPDMSVNRQCVADFGALTQWRKENTVDLERYVRMGMLHLFFLFFFTPLFGLSTALMSCMMLWTRS